MTDNFSPLFFKVKALFIGLVIYTLTFKIDRYIFKSCFTAQLNIVILCKYCYFFLIFI